MLELLKGSLLDLSNFIKKNNYDVYVYGAGMIGKIVIPDFCARFGIENHIKKYIDRDKKKCGHTMQVNNIILEICQLDDIEIDIKRSLLLISNSDYSSIVDMLDAQSKYDLSLIHI